MRERERERERERHCINYAEFHRPNSLVSLISSCMVHEHVLITLISVHVLYCVSDGYEV